MLGMRPVSMILLAGITLVWGCAGCESESSAPEAGWPTAPPEEQGFDSAALAEVVEQIDAQETSVDSLLIVRNGVLVLDAYFHPYRNDLLHDVASVTKSVTSTLVGIASDRGLLRLDQNLVATFPELVPEPPTDGKEDIALRHLLTMTSGLDCGRTTGEPELAEMTASEHWVDYALGIPMAVPPGSEFAYCSPGSHLLSAMITKATGRRALDFARDVLFEPLGIREAKWPDDPQGISRGWGDLQLHPRDMARIGLLFLREGAWNDVQVVSKEWVREAVRHQVTAETDGTGYGYQWWVLAGVFEGIYEARGRGGQAIIVWPDKDVVAVFTGGGTDVRGRIAPSLVAALKSDSALPPNPEANAGLAAAIEAAAEPPLAKPVPPLPPMAAQVSGKTYRLGANQFDLECMALDFSSASDVFLELTIESAEYGFAIGFDAVPRISETGPTDVPVGITGEWTEPSVLLLHYDEVAGPNLLEIRSDFGVDPETVTVELTDASGYFPPQSIDGLAVATCP
ncbi:MAG: hypothetical protein AMJ62_11940 [Myxococcales bacterium SG8_38]|nr:MAG: hypothetical protein AMJ62_11940 [Myxococcales bacterium SG8_38]